MNLLRLIAIVVASLVALNPAAAQWQTPAHSVPIGQGVGVTGFGSAAPGTAGQPYVSNGPGADPSFQALPVAPFGAFYAFPSTNQFNVPSATYTPVHFDAVKFDIGNHFNTSTFSWTPPAGLVMIGAQVFAATGVGGINVTYLFKFEKNGADVCTGMGGLGVNGFSGSAQAFGSCIDVASGSDSYNVNINATFNPNVTTITWSGGVASLQYATAFAAMPATFPCTISGVTPSGYNAGPVTCTSIDALHVAYPLASNPGAYVSGGSITGSPVSIDSNQAHTYFWGSTLLQQ